MANLNLKMPGFKINANNILPSVSANLSTFDLSESLLTTIKPDLIYPLYWRELQPGDKFEINVSSLLRLMPTVAPPMTRAKLKLMAFWVPNRTIWKNWPQFFGEKKWQEDTMMHRVPQISMKSAQNKTGNIADYLGIPPTLETADYTVSALPFRAYNKIYNEWFRINYMMQEVKEFSDDTTAEETLDNYQLKKIAKAIDYFTSCLPQPEQIDVSLADSAPVMSPLSNGNAAPESHPRFIVDYYNGSTHTPVVAGLYGSDSTGESMNIRGSSLQGKPTSDINTNLYADMSAVTGVSVNGLSKAIAMQRLYQKDMRSGQRFPDLLHEHFGVDIPDFLLGRSEFVGSQVVEIDFEPVVQSSESQATPQGNLTAVGIGGKFDSLTDISCVEHGHLMILGVFDSEVIYQQGLDRKWEKRDRFDYYFPVFANLGEQAVMEREIMLTPENAKSNKVFGYVPRYREEREGYNKITGLMRSNVSEGYESLDVWHLGQKFANPPGLNTEFLESSSPFNRIMSVPEEDNLLLNLYFDIKATRAIPVQSNPSIVPGKL